MDPSPPSTDPDLIRKVLARLRHWEFPFAARSGNSPSPVMRDRQTHQLVADDAVLDLNAVMPDWIVSDMMWSMGNSELDVPEVMVWFFRWYGFTDFYFGEGPRQIHADEFGTLYQLGEFDVEGFADYDAIMNAVLVEDSVRQADGSPKTHLLPVPPEINTARAAVAWTFGFTDPKDYQPIIET